MKTSPECRVDVHNETLKLALTGCLDAGGVSTLLPRAVQKIRTASNSVAASGKALVIDLEKLEYMDTSGASFIHRLQKTGKDQGIKDITLMNVPPEYNTLLGLAKEIQNRDITGIMPEKLSFIAKKGEGLAEFLSEAREFITLLGEIIWALLQCLLHPKKIRWSETFLVAERSGIDALPIVALISFIVGLVMAFQAAIPMRMFGTEIYVANLIGMAMVRELGPLMTAIVLTGRSASAFAAEIGTMRINEEIDALTVMGIDPVKFIIVPRIIASFTITPLLTIFANLVGIIGGALVIMSMGYPLIAYYNQISSFIGWGDFVGGIAKCFIFGIIIAISGCIRGYQTRSGASGVGISTTRAVVTGIILVTVADAVFSIIYYSLGI